MDLVLKGLKTAKFASDETLCFAATLWVDGKRLCTVENDGHGGGDYIHPVKGRTYDEINEVQGWLAENAPPLDMSKYGHENKPCDIELWVSRECSRQDDIRWVKSQLRTRTIVKDTDGNLLELKRKRSELPDGVIDKWIAEGKAVLNDMPIEEAVSLLVEREAY